MTETPVDRIVGPVRVSGEGRAKENEGDFDA